MTSALLLWWVLADVNFTLLWKGLLKGHPLLLVAAVGMATLTFPLRTVRWRYLLALDGEVLPWRPLWHATAIGFMANNLLPARAGEFARGYAANRLTGVRFTAALATIAAERLFDGATLVGFLAVALWAGGFEAGTTVGQIDLPILGETTVTLAWLLRAAGGFFGVCAAAILAVVHWPRVVLAAFRHLCAPLLPRRWTERALHELQGLLSGLEALRSFRRLTRVMLWSLVIWLCDAVAFRLGFLAFDIDTPWSAALLLPSLVAFGIAIPSAPGYFGPFEAVSRVALSLYGVEAEQALAFAIAFHVSGFIPISLLGLWSLSRTTLGLADLRRATAE